MTEDAIVPLIQNIITTNYDDLDSKVVFETKKRTIDTIGAMLAGSNAKETEIFLSYIENVKCAPVCSIFNFGIKTLATEAVMVNATMARNLDLDDVFEKSSTHIHVSVVPTALAIAEMLGNVTGKEFINSIVLGGDLIARLSLANKVPTAISGMNATYQLAAFGCVATAGKLLKLNKKQLLNAMGIAYAHSSGNSQCLVEGAMTTRLGGGISAKNGVVSVLLAKKGFTGVQKVLEGKFGYYKLYQRNEYDRNLLLNDLGNQFLNIETTIKQYPCCMHTHAAIIALEKIVKDLNIDLEKIDRVDVKVNQQAYNLVCLGKNQKRKPKSIAEAQFSLAYILGTILEKKTVGLSDFTAEKIKSKARLKYSSLVTSSVDEELDRRTKKEITPAIVDLYLKNGEHYKEFIHERKGSPKNPMSIEEVKNKFQDCCLFSKNFISEKNQEKIFGKIMNAENYNSLEIVKLLT